MLLLKFSTASFLERGGSLSYLSAFPEEAEILFPPLTFMRPVKQERYLEDRNHEHDLARHVCFTIGTTDFTVIQVTPVFAS